ncbi:MAG TPA: ribosome maturation factor RimM [Microbacteriaceae bacterium]|nr:ribosome maturation factor RimM [Microbacteriaceae bacterium]
MPEKTANGSVRVGRLTKAHGLKGALKVELYTDIPEQRFQPGATFSLQVPDDSPWNGKSLELIELRWYNEQPVAFFVGVTDRTAAETLARAILWIDEDAASAIVEENAWFDHQLVGLSVVHEGRTIGTVKVVDHLPAQDLLIVSVDGRDVMIPFVSAIVPEVDVAAGTITITPPPGLLEELPSEDDAAE